ncbi:Inositol-tetrakisphosphate 1-kinase 1 [Morus notabilis]|uniref:Inositol-tetrakisphosphate 1-kinase n=1 Tax=Morus notabilis TaxID=981085 RepID=W9QMZ5_9ROSA|nr:inositol-tetrakisphosphate 1-kinase 1 [Morus notabilis]EXB29144.1 Inositol-tetrakisphosphate 1-kinase 1 [Morus notabilis]
MSASERYCIGYALQSNKVKTFIRPSLLDHAAHNGIVLVTIDPTLPLTDQAPFHCILHKVYDQNWIQNLREFTTKSPTTVIVDPPDRIQRLHNRISMLDAVNRVRITEKFDLGVPEQVAITDSDELKKKKDLELKFPAIAKPLEANGTAASHEMFLVFNADGLEKILKESKNAMVVQVFVNHGGVVFKVYVVGDRHVKCVKRRSMPDISPEDHGDSDGGVMPFSQISNSNDEVNLNLKEVEMPPDEIVEEVARSLREELGLRLFNFDLIRDCNGKYFVIDINYFPGYEKMPDYEPVLTDFLLDLVQNKPTN